MRRIDLRIGLLFLVFFIASCSGSGLNCSGCASSCGGNPNYKFKSTMIKSGVKTRITQAGFDFITRNIKPMITAMLAKSGQQLSCSGSGMKIADIKQGNGPTSGGKAQKPDSANCITHTTASNLASCSGSKPKSSWYYAGLLGNNVCGTINSNSVKIRLNESDNSLSIEYNIPEIQIRSKNPDIGYCAKKNFNWSVGSGQFCGNAVIQLSNVRLRLTNLAGKIKLKFSVDKNTGKISLKVPSGGVTFSTKTKFEMLVSGCKAMKIKVWKIFGKEIGISLGQSFCSGLTKLIVKAINASKFIQPLIFKALGGVIQKQIKDMDMLATAKMEMEVPIAPLLGGFGLPGLDKAKALGFKMEPGTDVGVVRGGLNLGMDLGFESNPPHRCVPRRPVPTEKPGVAPSLIGNFHLGASLSRAAANRTMWAAYHTGALCIGLTTSDVSRMSGGGFTLNAGILALLAPNLPKLVPQDAPILLKMQPTQAPRIEFGTGQKINGKTDSTIQLQIPDLGFSFYVMLHDRYVRIFKLLLDLRLGMSLFPTPTNTLEITIDTDTLALTNARIEQANMVNTADVSKLLPTLVSMITKTMGNKKISFNVDLSTQISKALGVPITLKINKLKRDGIARDWMSLTMTMSNKPHPLLPRPLTVATIQKPNSGLTKKVGNRLIPTGEIFLEVPEYLGNYKLEYQYYVDFGAWSDFHVAPNGHLKVRDPILNLLGKHTIMVRARIKGEYRTLEETPVAVKFTFDPIAPQVSIIQKNGMLRIAAADAVTIRSKLRREAFVSGKWVSLESGFISIEQLKKKQSSLRIRVIDEQGNKKELDWSLDKKSVIASQDFIPSNNEFSGHNASGCACSTNNANQEFPSILFLLLILPLFLRRRK